jgi:hypothetical protein
MTKRIMREFQMNEISAVDRPAQKGARAVIMKRDIGKADAPTKTEGGKAFPGSDYAYVPDKTKPSGWKLRLTSEPGGAPDPGIVGAAAAALGPGYRGQKVDIPASDRPKVIARVRAAWAKANPDKKPADMPEGIRKVTDPLIDLIAKNLPGDTDGDAFDFATAMGGLEVGEQTSAMMDELCEMWSALMSSVSSIRCDDEMSPDQKLAAIKGSITQYVTMLRDKAPDGLIDDMSDALAGDPAGDQTVSKKETPMSDELKKVADLEKQIADLTKRATDAEAKAADLVKAAEIAKSDETFTAEGTTIRKSEVGEGTFKLLKSQHERLELGDFEKRAAAEVPNLPGEAITKAKALRAVAKMDKDTADALTAMLKAGNEAMKKAFTPIGSDAGRSFSKAEDELTSLAKAHAEKHNVSFAKAYDAVLKTDEGRRLYSETLKPQVAA